jgi:hypothetical protein
MSDGGAHAEMTAPPAASAVQRTGRQRRPTGAPPPLPRRIAVTTTAWVALAAILVAGAFLVSERTPWRAALDRASTWILQQLATVRTPWLTHVANGINAAGLYWSPAIGVIAVLLIMVFRRWRHLLVLLFCLFFLEIVVSWIYNGLTRPRPFGVWIIGRWDGVRAEESGRRNGMPPSLWCGSPRLGSPQGRRLCRPAGAG